MHSIAAILALFCAANPRGWADDVPSPKPPAPSPIADEADEFLEPPPPAIPDHAEGNDGPADDDGKLYEGKSVQDWIKLSRDKNAKVRSGAFRALLGLGRKNNKEAVRGLIAGLADSDAEVSGSVHRGLEKMLDSGHGELIPILACGLVATEPLEVRRGIASLFLLTGPSRQMRATVSALRTALKDDDAQVRVETAIVLWQCDPNAADLVPVFVAALDDSNSKVKWTAFEGLEMMGPSAAAAVVVLGERLRNDPDTSEHAGRVLKQIGKPAVPTLILGLGAESKEVRIRSAEALERIGLDAADAVPGLHGSLRDDNFEVRLSAAEALWRIERKASAVLPVFVDAYQQRDLNKRLRAVSFFEETWPKSPEALACYAAAMRDPDACVRVEAIRGRSLVRPLPEILSQALVSSLKDSEDTIVQIAIARLSSIQADAYPYLLPACRDGPPRARSAALRLLDTDGEHREEVAAVCLRALRDDGAPSVRRAAIQKLGECGEAKEKALSELLVALNDPHPGVRADAAKVLKFFNGDRDSIVAALIECLRDPEGEVRAEAAKGLGYLRRRADEAVPALIGALKDTKEEVQRSAAIALGQFGPEAKAAIPHLITRLDESSTLHFRKGGRMIDEEMGDGALFALVRIGSDAAPALAEALTHEQGRVRIQAAIALEKIGPEGRAAIPQLKKALSDPDGRVRKHAREALKAIDPELAKKLLVS
jgi:HEAT repeat protein